jgi:nucleoside-diphosphate-sugar epimerase
MHIVVTGSSGKVGSAAVHALKAAGHRVTCLDLIAPADGPRTVRVDCTDFGAVMAALSGIDAVGGRPDAVVHLAGIPAPGLTTDHAAFDTNVSATYNVFSTCARLGINRVVWASSETILGLPFDTPPDFAPLTEAHPDRPSWSYALSKQLGEAMAETFARWHPAMTILSLRFSNVYTPSDYAAVPGIQARPETRKWNLWGYVDADDAGRACALAVDADLGGHHRMIIAAADTIAGQASADLMASHFPGVPLHGVSGDQSLLSSAAAEKLIGYRPAVSWRDRVDF